MLWWSRWLKVSWAHELKIQEITTLSKLVAAGKHCQKQADSTRFIMVRTIVRFRQLAIGGLPYSFESSWSWWLVVWPCWLYQAFLSAYFYKIQAVFLEFEHFYQGKLAYLPQRKLVLEISNQEISNGYARLPPLKESKHLNLHRPILISAYGNSSPVKGARKRTKTQGA